MFFSLLGLISQIMGRLKLPLLSKICASEESTNSLPGWTLPGELSTWLEACGTLPFFRPARLAEPTWPKFDLV